MLEVIRFRARRFHALIDVLTGTAHPVPTARHRIPDHLLEDVGLQAPRRQERPISHFGIFPVAPFKP
jgi:hypothetical protein